MTRSRASVRSMSLLAGERDVVRVGADLTTAVGYSRYGLPASTVVAVDRPAPATGLVVTDRSLPRDTDIAALRDWVDALR